MASPIEIIKQGIQKGDWKKVTQGYNRLSGDKLKAPSQIVAQMEVEDVPERVIQEIEANVITRAIGRLSSMLDINADGDIQEEEEEEEEDEDEDEIKEEEVDPGGETESSPPGEAHPAGSIESRAAEARAILRGERPLPDFTHIHTGKQEGDVHPELGRKARVEPFKPGTFKNNFVDDRRQCRGDIKIDRKLTKGLRPIRRRPAIRKVKVQCFKCEKKYMVDPDLAPRVIKAEDGSVENTHYVCDDCMKRSVA